jgi:hypothetical protein
VPKIEAIMHAVASICVPRKSVGARGRKQNQLSPKKRRCVPEESIGALEKSKIDFSQSEAKLRQRIKTDGEEISPREDEARLIKKNGVFRSADD